MVSCCLFYTLFLGAIILFNVQDQVTMKTLEVPQFCKYKPPFGYEFGTCIDGQNGKNQTECVYFFKNAAKNCYLLYSEKERPLLLGQTNKIKKK